MAQAKATHGIRVTRDTKAMSIKFELVNKSTEKVDDELVLLWETVHDDAKDFCSLYGVSKILMDRCSGEDMLDKLAAYADLFSETLQIGITEKERSKPGRRLTSIQAQALMRHYDASITAVQASWNKCSEEKKKQILESEKVQALIKEIKDEAEDESLAFDDLTD